MKIQLLPLCPKIHCCEPVLRTRVYLAGRTPAKGMHKHRAMQLGWRGAWPDRADLGYFPFGGAIFDAPAFAIAFIAWPGVINLVVII